MRDLDLGDNAAQVVRLSFADNACGARMPDLVIGNIHVLFNHKRGDIKLGQVPPLPPPLPEKRTAPWCGWCTTNM